MTLWSSEAITVSSYNGVMGIGLDSPETGCDGNVFVPMRGRSPHTGGGRSLTKWVVTISQDE